MNALRQQFIEHIAYNIRVSSLQMTTNAGSGHPTSALSCADIIAALFFYGMCFDPKNPHNSNNDRFILSKGHAAPALYAVWEQLGVLTYDQLMHYRTFNAELEGHPTPRFSRVQVATGSLGQGLSIGAGICLSGLLDKKSFKTYVLMGDSEMTEGQIWEAITCAGYYKLHNLVGIIDVNNLGQSTQTIDDYNVEQLATKVSAFGWHTIIINGHDMHEIIQALDYVKNYNGMKPCMIIAKTIKGYGIGSVQGKPNYHGKAFSKEELPQIIAQLDNAFAQQKEQVNYHWEPTIPTDIQQHTEVSITLPIPDYHKGQMIATRKAYGQGLVALGKSCQRVVSLDAEVKNSTYAQLFEDIFPERFIQCFVAEQNMVSMGVGFVTSKKIPFISTFGAFFTRTFDQLRMAAIGCNALRLCGSHVGVSIGQDGPSQMALEDIAMIQTLPKSVILYPSDGVSTYKLMQCMANYHDGISYLRTTRSEVPILYENNEEFVIGGCKILRQSDNDVACIIAGGITVFEALKAYEQLKKDSIFVRVIDLYSVKPLDLLTIIESARASHNKLITVEDHYIYGGIGQAVVCAVINLAIKVTCLAVRELPRSGLPQDLLSFEQIDAQAIVKTVISLVD